MTGLGSANQSGFVFFAAFDGTNNDMSNLSLSGSQYQTNVANLFDQASLGSVSSENLRARYYPGVGTGGTNGNLYNAALAPTGPIFSAATQALTDFARAAQDYLDANPGATFADITASATGFSRGAATAVVFAQLLETNGLVTADGTVVAPPGSIQISGLALLDPVYTGINRNLSIPQNVIGPVLVVRAIDEDRLDFAAADYSNDIRVTTVEVYGNHCGIGGGYDLNGTAAAVLEGVTGYLQNSGVPLADVPANLQFDPNTPAQLYTELYQTAHNGDVLVDSNGQPSLAWRPATDERALRSVLPPQDSHDPTDPYSIDAVNGLDHLSDQYSVGYCYVDADGDVYEYTGAGTMVRALPGDMTEQWTGAATGAIHGGSGQLLAQLSAGDSVSLTPGGSSMIQNAEGVTIGQIDVAENGALDVQLSWPDAGAGSPFESFTQWNADGGVANQQYYYHRADDGRTVVTVTGIGGVIELSDAIIDLMPGATATVIGTGNSIQVADNAWLTAHGSNNHINVNGNNAIVDDWGHLSAIYLSGDQASMNIYGGGTLIENVGDLSYVALRGDAQSISVRGTGGFVENFGLSNWTGLFGGGNGTTNWADYGYVESYGDNNWVSLNGNYASTTVWGAYSAIESHGVSNWLGLQGHHIAATSFGDGSTVESFGANNWTSLQGDSGAALMRGAYGALEVSGDDNWASLSGDHASATVLGDHNAIVSSGASNWMSLQGDATSVNGSGIYNTVESYGDSSLISLDGHHSAVSLYGEYGYLVSNGDYSWGSLIGGFNTANFYGDHGYIANQGYGGKIYDHGDYSYLYNTGAGSSIYDEGYGGYSYDAFAPVPVEPVYVEPVYVAPPPSPTYYDPDPYYYGGGWDWYDSGWSYDIGDWYGGGFFGFAGSDTVVDMQLQATLGSVAAQSLAEGDSNAARAAELGRWQAAMAASPNAAGGRDVAVGMGVRWEDGTVAWALGDEVEASNLPTLQLAWQAFGDWAAVSGLQFEYTEDDEAADILIGFETFNTSDTGVVGYTSFQVANGYFESGVQIHLQSPDQTSLHVDEQGRLVYSNTEADVLQVLRHEIGHALGLATSTDEDSVMGYKLDGDNRNLNATDIAGIQAIYGADPATTADNSLISLQLLIQSMAQFNPPASGVTGPTAGHGTQQVNQLTANVFG